MSGFRSDVRSGLRALRASPAYLVLGALCLAIGIGATVLTFTVVDDALLRPLGSLDASRLVEVAETRDSAPNQWWPVSRASLLDWRNAVGERAELGALRGASFAIAADGTTSRVDGAYATGNLFAVLGVAPLLGRTLEPSDEAAGSESVVVLSETTWRGELGSDDRVLGKTVVIDGVPHAVVGVVPALLGVGMPGAVRSARLWVPLRDDGAPLARTDRSLRVLGRLSADSSIESLAARLRAVALERAAAHPESRGWSVAVGSLGDNTIGVGRSTLLLSLGAAALVLLIACANVASLSLAHALRRRHEFAIRTAIGASPWRLARQLLVESLLVAAPGAVIGTLLARAGLDVLARVVEADSLAPVALPIDRTALAFTVGVACATALLFGLWPAWEATRGAARERIGASGAGLTDGRGRGRLRRALVVAQVAASLVLLVGAALLSRSFANLLAIPKGVETERVTSVRVESQGAGADADDVARYTSRVTDALAAVPGVESVAVANNMLPLRGGGMRSTAAVPGDARDERRRPVVAYVGVTPNFFRALGVPLLRGGTFADADRGGRVAVVNERMATLLWPNDDPIGRQFRLDGDPDRGWITVVGVSGNVLTWDSNREQPLPTAYLHFASFPSRPIFFFLRTRDATLAVSPQAVYRAIDALGFSIKRIVVTPMTRVAQDPFWRQRVFSEWFVVFGAAAVVLTLAGIYGVLAHLVAQRGKEIGIRMALGAGRRRVLALILREGALFVGVGVAIGLLVACAAARGIRGMLFGVEALDLPLFVGIGVALAAVAMAAALAPALRAARVDPTELLRR